jgi:hypothetical protein
MSLWPLGRASRFDQSAGQYLTAAATALGVRLALITHGMGRLLGA